jgi:hypothetical protein
VQGVGRAFFLSICLAGLPGCEAVAVSLLGASAGTALRYGWDGVTHRTFTSPAADVKQASLAALERMGIAFESFDVYEHGELIYARAQNRAIEIEIEPISERATRVRISAKNGSLFYDSATSAEIVAQTERLLQATVNGAAMGGTSF